VSGSHEFYQDRYEPGLQNVRAAIYREIYDDFIEQSSWLSTATYDRLFSWLELDADSHVLDVACGGGGPAIRLVFTAGCSAIGIDNNADAISRAVALSYRQNIAERVRFECRDGDQALPFGPETFDAVVCFDAIPLFGDRLRILGEWRRVLKPQGRLLYTGPVMTGPISNLEIAERTNQGRFVLVPPGYDASVLADAGLQLIRAEDVTQQLAEIAEKHCAVRLKYAELLREREGAAVFEKENRYREVAECLARERRLSHYAFLACKPR